ncbi:MULTISPECIES: DUF421 domain-containing protein [Bacillus]|uniref:DUF421 domain-containing protein n=1 Tax=Bacillus pumilus TaxID=1408 RepID=A0A2G8ISE6_BACPU|nr:MULTISPECIES: DUF421 domain-containing protein [Bacillus]MCC9087404.1 DUF421 domain-containing protein [Bacillus pumilus]MED1749126.1 DUF421 domain-containing protein [Bacillus zhangzhouensis]PIK26420.1 hypothetical protein CTV99_12465 [Bacillus pumilus]
MPFLSILVELFIGFSALFFITKLLGKTQFAQITPFDFISALILGEMVGNAIFDPEVKIQHILFAVAIWGVLIYTVEWLSQRFKSIRALLEGRPTLVIDKGNIRYNRLKKNMLDLNQLQTLIRAKGHFALHEIEYAILETDGSVSVLPKMKYAPATAEDVNVKGKEVKLPRTFIIDGEILRQDLQEAGFDETWLRRQLKKQHISSYKEVLFCEWIENEGIYAMKYEKSEKTSTT